MKRSLLLLLNFFGYVKKGRDFFGKQILKLGFFGV